MRIECKARDLHAAINDAWERERPEVTCPEVTCPECDSRLSEAGRCWDCTASDYLEEPR
jgi:hypothetical protein